MKLKELMVKNRISIEEYLRYMDDGRVFIHPIRPGWRWIQGDGLRYKERWRGEDEGLTPLEITRRVIEGSMQDVLPFLKFTTEVGEGEGLWLPTLDILIRVEENNITSYRYFEKPTTTNVMVQKRSALEENSKTQILANDLVRRLGNTDTRQANTVLGGVVDQFGVKVMTSGYTLMQARRIVISGLKGWERKLRRAKKEGRRIFKTSGDSLSGRIRKKMLGKTSWYRKKRRIEEDDRDSNQEGRQVQGDHSRRDKNKYEKRSTPENRTEVRTAAVLFVENTKGGMLAKKMREIMENLKHILGYNIKIVERAGTPLKLMFSLAKIGEGGECGRGDCIPCTQDSRGEKLPPCRKRNILYENICLKCNPEAGSEDKRKEWIPPAHPPSIYVGESARSLYERGKEHWANYRAGLENSHILKHHLLHHGGQGEPAFHLRPVMYFKTALSRQVAEASRIQKLGEDAVLNSKDEFNRSKIRRLVIGEERNQEQRQRTQEEEADIHEASREERRWEKDRAESRRVLEIRGEINLERGVAKSPPRKRTGSQEDPMQAKDEEVETSNSGGRLGRSRRGSITIRDSPSHSQLHTTTTLRHHGPRERSSSY